MKHRYYIKGVTCNSCKEKISGAWMHISGIIGVKFVDKGTVDVIMDRHIELEILQDALVSLEKYTVFDKPFGFGRVWSALFVYRGLLLILSLIILFTIIDVFLRSHGLWDSMMAFMGRWFIVFSALKLYNLS